MSRIVSVAERVAANGEPQRLVRAMLRNVDVLSGRAERSVELTRPQVEVGVLVLRDVEAVATIIEKRRGIDRFRAFDAIARTRGQDGLCETEQSMTALLVASRFHGAGPNDKGGLVFAESTPAWADGVDGLVVARAAAYVMLGTTPDPSEE